jgi:hypothetical protein
LQILLIFEELGEKKAQELPPDYCGSCYGAETNPGDCCNTCEQVQEMYRKKGWAFVNAEGIEQVRTQILKLPIKCSLVVIFRRNVLK